ncbi:MAG: hypothetical protein KKA12_16420 [Alphaproteobacteria bacterium]|nr:hypothetical protein [Alphaproteobacteria bacterium]
MGEGVGAALLVQRTLLITLLLKRSLTDLFRAIRLKSIAFRALPVRLRDFGFSASYRFDAGSYAEVNHGAIRRAVAPAEVLAARDGWTRKQAGHADCDAQY